MICELFPFQKQAVNEMRLRVAMALNNYRMLKIPQVVSLQAPTGSGKTIIMSALIEDIFYGSEQFTEQPEAIFVWLSDSPQLNEQSKQKIELKADKVRMDQCVVISDESFDREILEDGHIYFLNTQKLGKAGNLSRHSDTRQYTIWETIENTAREKADRLYFIIDEAHRGMQGRQAGTATTIMQRFIKGSSEQNLSPIPVVIGMSATAERFNSLVGQATNSTLHKVVISPAQVRQSGLLKDRIVITYPEDPIKHGDMAVLQAATDEWQDKCKHWYQYTYEQHYTNVNPVFVIQVCAGSGTKVSDTDLDDVIAKIEERMGDSFKENEVVHTFGSTGTLSIHGLTVPHIEPSEIAEDRRIRVVLFKENLSTGWEQTVLAEEQKREDYVCWLRNPSRQSWSLRMPYEMDGKCKELYPDFIIVRQDPILKYIVDILEPHNPDFKDNLGKAKGLANYAANEPRIGRVQLIRIGKDAAGKNRFKRLDLAKGSIRNKVLAAINTDELDHIFDTDGVFED